MDTEQDSTQNEQEAPADPVQPADEDAKADPQEVDYKERYAALKTDYDKIVKERKDAKPETPAEAPTENEIDWKIENADRIKLVKPELQTYLAKGIPRDEALRLAELDKGVTKSSPDAGRQAATSGTASFVQRSTTPEVALTEHDRRFGLTAQRKKELQQKYPDLLEE